jgi:hypothetical protein
MARLCHKSNNSMKIVTWGKVISAFICLAGAVVVPLLSGCVASERAINEPSLEGYTLTEWLTAYCSESSRPHGEAAGKTALMRLRSQWAITEIGTNAIPFLLVLLRGEAGSARHGVAAIPSLQGYRSDCGPWFEKRMGRMGFEVLGVKGQSALPALINLTQSANSDTRFEAMWSIVALNIREEILWPILMRMTYDSDQTISVEASEVLKVRIDLFERQSPGFKHLDNVRKRILPEENEERGGDD